MAVETLQLDGLKQAQQAVRRFGGTPETRKTVNKLIVDRLLVPPSKVGAPKRSGRLRESVRSDSSPLYGFILAGSKGSVPYAGVIHFGWSTRGLGASISGDAGQRRTALRAAYQAAGGADGGALGRRSIDKAARLGTTRTTVIKERDTSTGRFVKGGKTLGTVTKRAVRGGPIRPRPFIYAAIDSRRNAVFDEYDRQLEHRARIEEFLYR